MTPHVLGEIRRWLGSIPSASRESSAVKTLNMDSVRLTPAAGLTSRNYVRHNYITMAPRSPRRDAKADALRAHGALHPRPEAVQDPLFASHDFFDRRDLVQVKYEMLRQVDVEGQPVARTASFILAPRPSRIRCLRRTTFSIRGISCR